MWSELVFGGGGGVEEGLRGHEGVVLGPDVHPSHWSVRSRPQLTSRGQGSSAGGGVFQTTAVPAGGGAEGQETRIN